MTLDKKLCHVSKQFEVRFEKQDKIIEDSQRSMQEVLILLKQTELSDVLDNLRTSFQVEKEEANTNKAT